MQVSRWKTGMDLTQINWLTILNSMFLLTNQWLKPSVNGQPSDFASTLSKTFDEQQLRGNQQGMKRHGKQKEGEKQKQDYRSNSLYAKGLGTMQTSAPPRRQSEDSKVERGKQSPLLPRSVAKCLSQQNRKSESSQTGLFTYKARVHDILMRFFFCNHKKGMQTLKGFQSWKQIPSYACTLWIFYCKLDCVAVFGQHGKPYIADWERDCSAYTTTLELMSSHALVCTPLWHRLVI